jgi:hypothetical protein
MNTDEIIKHLQKYPGTNPYIYIGLTTEYRIRKCLIKSEAFDDDLFRIVDTGEAEGNPVLFLEKKK